MKKQPKSTRVSMLWTPKLLERLRQWAGERELTLSDAVRRLVEQGIEK
jgi:hypothetical protein